MHILDFQFSGGTPQSSIISPILFVIITFSLGQVTKYCLYFKYANDLTTLHKHDSPFGKDDLQIEVNNVISWSTTFSMPINERKTNLMHISGRKTT